MPEAVDRLELVPDREDLGQFRVGDEVDQLGLEPVRVLELVDHDHPEAKPRLVADCVVVAKQVAGRKLEILEVDDRLTALGGRVLGAEALEELLEEIAIEGSQLLESRPLGRLARQLERRCSRSPACEGREIHETLRGRSFRRDAQDLAGVPPLRRRRRSVGGEALRLDTELGHRALDARALPELEDELAPGGAKRLVDAGEHAPQPVGAVRREQPESFRVAVGAELPERTLERLAAQHRGSRVLELAEPRVEAGGERMRAQQPVAEAVDRRDPRSVELAREVGTPALAQRGADATPQLAGRLARVRDDEDGLDVDAALAHRAYVPLDENRRLPRARSRGHEDRALGLDGSQLLVVEPGGRLHDRHARGTRQIGQRSHQAGHPSPFGSWRTSPALIRCAFSPARSRADSTCAQNVSSSR